MISANTLISDKEYLYVRPDTLSEGNNYLLLERQSCHRLVQETVQFVSYTACPGTVIVLDSQNQRIRTPRDRLFFITGTSQSVNPAIKETEIPIYST